MDENRLFVSVDVDDWYFARWATGSKNALWPDIETLSKAVYDSPHPPNNLEAALERIIDLFRELRFSSTFFITGYMAEKFPSLVQQIIRGGHELGSHNYYHLDYEYEPATKFREDLRRSRALLEDVSGTKVIGYRSPNSSIPANIVRELIDSGFEYDSSVTPTRRIMGKFGDHVDAPRHPYFTDEEDIGRQGSSSLLELPWSVLPLVKLPAGSGIMHRIMGNAYNSIATNQCLKKGHTSYYFHPYEINDQAELKRRRLPVKARIFLRNTGQDYFEDLRSFLTAHKNRLINGSTLTRHLKQGARARVQAR